MAARGLPKSSTQESGLSVGASRRGRFYSKCLLLRAVTGVATEQTTSYFIYYWLANWISYVIQ